MSSGSKPQTVGYRYFMGVQLALCHGPADAVTELIVGERQGWQGEVTKNDQIYVDKPELFGGEKQEGGLVGLIDICMGDAAQGQNDYLAKHIDPKALPAYRGLVTTVFRSFMWSALNPYFKSPWWRVRRILKGWSRDTVWYPEKARIGSLDMNPAHVIYQALTDVNWGMGYSPDDIDDASFRAEADQLYKEGFGVSLLWSDSTSIEDFLQSMMNTVNGSLRMSTGTGRFVLKLVRDNYKIEDLVHLDPSNIIDLESFQRVAWGDTANEVIVTYTDRDQNEATVAVQDLASIEAQGGVVSTTRTYSGIRDFELATRVAMRDLNTCSSPLSKVTLRCNRVAWNLEESDVFVLSWPRLGLVNVPFRIAKINKGNLVKGEIRIEAVEDLFGLPDNAYVAQQTIGWQDPVKPPAVPSAGRVVEAPYWDIVKGVSPADIAMFDPGYAFAQVLAVRPSSDSYGYDLWESPNNYSFEQVGAGDFVPSGTLAADMPRAGQDLTFTIQSAVALDQVDVGTYCYIDNEILGITAVNVANSTITASRAGLDTVPAAHVKGARVYFRDEFEITDPTQRISGETVYVKPLTRTGKGTLALDKGVSLAAMMVGRADRPYPPGNFQVSGSYFPSKVYGPITLSWSHRSRIQQTVDITPFTRGNIGPEAGVTYTVKVYDGTTLKRTVSGISGTSWTYDSGLTAADGSLANPRFVLTSVRGGLESWQSHDITIERHGLGFRLGEELGGVSA